MPLRSVEDTGRLLCGWAPEGMRGIFGPPLSSSISPPFVEKDPAEGNTELLTPSPPPSPLAEGSRWREWPKEGCWLEKRLAAGVAGVAGWDVFQWADNGEIDGEERLAYRCEGGFNGFPLGDTKATHCEDFESEGVIKIPPPPPPAPPLPPLLLAIGGTGIGSKCLLSSFATVDA